MIPKIIHYCWFGRGELPDLAKKCIKSWKKYCPDYEIIEWNEDNFDIQSAPLYVRQAYEAKKWAFVTDYVRLKIVYDNGGIYLDTDVELIKPLNRFLDHKAFFGFEDTFVATGLGFGAEKQTSILQEIMNQYADIPFFISENQYDDTACPERNTEVFKNHGLSLNGTTQILEDDILILSKEHLCPYNFLEHKLKKTKNTVAIHWFGGSWLSNEQRKKFKKYEIVIKKNKRKNKIYKIKHLPITCLRMMLGNDRVDKIKQIIKR